jgi:hypothetical protein
LTRETQDTEKNLRDKDPVTLDLGLERQRTQETIGPRNVCQGLIRREIGHRNLWEHDTEHQGTGSADSRGRLPPSPYTRMLRLLLQGPGSRQFTNPLSDSGTVGRRIVCQGLPKRDTVSWTKKTVIVDVVVVNSVMQAEGMGKG